jgi:catechol 2,3-dioxygenase-like lactoylglutathione lyase family enzyme
MVKARVTHLRYVGVGVPDFEETVDFYGGVWGLKRVDGDKDVAFFAAESSPEQYIYRVRRDTDKRLDLVAFGAEDRASVDALAQDLASQGVKLASEPGALQTPGGGYGFRLFDPDGRVVEVSTDVAPRQTRELDAREAIPVALNHVVFGSTDRKRSEQFYQEQLGFALSDWIPFMGFFRCNTNHHSLAIADGQATTLNHVAFEVSNIDSMMRGAGRVLKDGRAKVMMGPGRHSAGDNTFYYFFDPQGNVSEYTAEVEQIVDDDAWTPRAHPPTDMWGTAQMPGRPAGAPGPNPGGPAAAANMRGPDLPPVSMPQNDPGLWVAPPL